MDFIDHPVFNASNTCHRVYDEKKQKEMCEKLLRCMGNDKTLQKKYERECGSFVYQLRPDILWMA